MVSRGLARVVSRGTDIKVPPTTTWYLKARVVSQGQPTTTRPPSLGMSRPHMPAEVLFAHGFVGAAGALKPGDGSCRLVPVRDVRLKVVRPLGLEGAAGALQPLDSDAVPGGEVHLEVLFGFGGKGAVRTAKARAIWWRHCVHAAGRRGT